MRTIVALALSAVLATGCVQKIAESRVRSALDEAGLSSRVSGCMAERMVDRLDINQLRKLELLKARAGEPARPVTVTQYLDRVERVGDLEVLSVTSTSAALCVVGLGD